MEFIAEHQISVMLFMSGMCGILAVMTLLSKSLPVKTRAILASMEISAMFLLLFDRFAYKYQGDTSMLGFYMVRISNCMVYALSLVIPFCITRFIINLLKTDVKIVKKPLQLTIADYLFAIGMTLVLADQFIEFYYSFDETNHYYREPFFTVCYCVPLLIVILQEWVIIQNFKKLKRPIAVSMIISIALPTIASVFQIFLYGISITNMVTVLMVCTFHTYALSYITNTAERIMLHELDIYRQSQKKETAMFKETMEALAKAIDAKDKYTRGHSTRVALYSRLIAKKAGLSEEKCEQVYFAGLLHDIGKIGVSNDIINKNSKLTDSEFTLIKTHPELGYQILSTIKNAPYLSEGARYHHERYDGKGYPTGIAGEEIPEIARIIAVADAYDAMTSLRSYNDPLERTSARDEIEKGIGTQFDPKFAQIMLQLMDEEKLVL